MRDVCRCSFFLTNGLKVLTNGFLELIKDDFRFDQMTIFGDEQQIYTNKKGGTFRFRPRYHISNYLLEMEHQIQTSV